MRSCPLIHSRQQKKKNQKEKDYDGVASGTENPCPQSYKVAGSNPAPATIDNTRLTQCVGLFLCPKSIALIDFAQRCATFCANEDGKHVTHEDLCKAARR